MTSPTRFGARSSPYPRTPGRRRFDANGEERDNGQVAELTGGLDLSTWPNGALVIVRRERPHPGAQLSFTDHDGHRFQAILTDLPDPDIAALERRHRARARVEDRIRAAKDTGLGNLPFRDFDANAVWLELVLAAQGLLFLTQTLTLDGELARSEPKRLRYRGCCTPRDDSPSTPAKRSYASRATGPGPTSSRSPSPASPPSHRADRTAGPAADDKQPDRPASACPQPPAEDDLTHQIPPRPAHDRRPPDPNHPKTSRDATINPASGFMHDPG